MKSSFSTDGNSFWASLQLKLSAPCCSDSIVQVCLIFKLKVLSILTVGSGHVWCDAPCFPLWLIYRGGCCVWMLCVTKDSSGAALKCSKDEGCIGKPLYRFHTGAALLFNRPTNAWSKLGLSRYHVTCSWSSVDWHMEYGLQRRHGLAPSAIPGISVGPGTDIWMRRISKNVQFKKTPGDFLFVFNVPVHRHRWIVVWDFENLTSSRALSHICAK